MIDLGVLQGTIEITGMEETQSGLTDLGKSTGGLKGSFDKLLPVVKAVGSALAIGAVLKDSVGKANELAVATNNLAVKTGATKEEMTGLKDSIENIYAQNFGESFEDVANSLADVAQQTGLTGIELENATINAIALRDSFGHETNESIRAVDMMMKQFGVTSEEAFNLIAQGSQAGLDKNGNLLDSINEYSVHFEQLGLDAEDMFNMLANGAEQGVFDFDRLGDAIKEFGIRSKVLDDSGEAFEALGFNAEKMVQTFNEGGPQAEKALQDVIKALAECDDKVKQNELGVELFGRW